MYSDDDILTGCPEQLQLGGQKFITYEWRIKQAFEKASYFIAYLSPVELHELREFQASHELFRQFCKVCYEKDAEAIHFVLQNVLDSPLQEVFEPESWKKEEYSNLFYTLCKQNNILNYLRLKKIGSESETKGDEIELPFDHLHDVGLIIKANLWDNLTLKNYREILTWRQLELLRKIASDLRKLEMLDSWRTLTSSIRTVFASDEAREKATPFYDELFKSAQGEVLTGKEQKRKIFFKERWNDHIFVLERCRVHARDPLSYYLESEIEGFKRQGINVPDLN